MEKADKYFFIFKKENIVYMILCNTNDDEVVQINKTMVEKHYALYNEDWKQQKINQVYLLLKI